MHTRTDLINDLIDDLIGDLIVIDTLAEKDAIRLVWDRDAEQYVDPSTLEATPQRRGKQQGRPQEHFIKGPIPMAWLERACQLPGKAAHVAMAIWFVRGLRQREPFKVKQETLARFGVRHRAVYSRALAELESAGLIRVTRKAGQALGVTVTGTSAEHAAQEWGASD